MQYALLVYIILEPYFFHVFLKFKGGLSAVSFMTTPLYVLNLYCCNPCAGYKFIKNETNGRFFCL